jgi:hypothetical protein
VELSQDYNRATTIRFLPALLSLMMNDFRQLTLTLIYQTFFGEMNLNWLMLMKAASFDFVSLAGCKQLDQDDGFGRV